MATIKTVKPLGGGDFSSLQAWEDWADDQVSSAQWAECYSGGDLGLVTLGGWTTYPVAPDIPRIYAAPGHQHTGVRGTGAYISIPASSAGITSYIPVEIIGIRMFFEYEAIFGIFLGSDYVNALSGVLIDKCLFETVVDFYSNFSSGIYLLGDAPGITGCTIRNCLFYPELVDLAPPEGLCSIQYPIYVDARLWGIVTGLVVDNNTIGGYASFGYGMWFRAIQGGTITATIRNNICMPSVPMADYNLFVSALTTYTFTNNMSSDATAGVYGGTGNLINKTASDQFVNTTSDLSLKATSEAINSGVTVATFSNDAIHTSGWRPQRGIWDMGALEKAATRVSSQIMIG